MIVFIYDIIDLNDLIKKISRARDHCMVSFIVLAFAFILMSADKCVSRRKMKVDNEER